MNRYLIGLGALLAMTACGGGESAPPSTQKPPTSAPAAKSPSAPKPTGSTAPASSTKTASETQWDASMGTATVSGTVRFEGAAPQRAAIDTASDAKCHATVLDEKIVVNDGGLANVVISVSDGTDGYKFPKGTGSVTLDQKNCQYVPHTIALQAGQTLSISNSDETVHNVHSYSKRNQTFNQAQPAGAADLEKAMSQKDKMFPIKCDIHAWMNCNVAVFDHPFFAVTDGNGAFTLPKLPAGTYELTAEHAELGKQTTEITVADGGSETVTFSFALGQ